MQTNKASNWEFHKGFCKEKNAYLATSLTDGLLAQKFILSLKTEHWVGVKITVKGCVSITLI